MRDEIWKDIKGYEGYQVNNLGQVKSLYYGGKGIGKGCYKIERILKGDIDKEAKKIRYTLYANKHGHHIFGHIIVARAFPEICGEWFEGCQVHHKDCNPSNNNPNNLICLTQEEHQRIHMEMGQRVGVKNPFYGKHHTKKSIAKNRKAHKKPIIQMDMEGNEIMGWFSCTDCAKETGMEKAAINRCCLGKQHSSYGYKWRYAS